ncbi:MAG: hypothetical protein J6Y19_08445 [Kiritimatiellae bacterium]|nr:hypothetical protein [Kiritimatiellia bacterium]
MAENTVWLGIAGALALAWAAVCPAAEVREYGEENGKEKSGEVAFRNIAVPETSPYAGVSPLAIAFAPGFELPPEEWDVVALRFNILVGRHRNFHGLDFGGLGNYTVGEMGGIGVAGLFNDCGTGKAAIQAAGAVNHSSWDYSGAQVSGLFSWTEGLHTGLQIASANKAGRLSGVQIGALNMTGRGTGLQIGVVNVAERLEGFQIGVVNINRDSTVPFLPVINFAF